MPNSPQGSQAGDGGPPERRRTIKSQLTLRRRGTGISTKSNKEKEKEPFQEHFACYEDLTWEALKAYLLQKWPHIGLEERERTVSTYPSALAAYAMRLDFVAPNLFVTDVAEVDVPIRDLQTNDGNGEELHKLNINMPGELTSWFGLKIVQDLNDPQNPVVAVQQKDPKCRVVYIYGTNSRVRLRITRSMLLELLTFHQVMPEYLDFISIFGLPSEAQDLRFSSFREQKNLKLQHGSAGIVNLGRSGRRYQLCYILRGVTSVSGYPDPISHENQWLINLQQWAEKVREVTPVIKSNIDVMTSLRRFYTDLRDNEEFPMRQSCGNDIGVFASQLGNLIDDLSLQIDRGDTLVRITTDRMELVKEHRLERLNQNMEKEAIIVRIITIVTLIYLPATFVFTFFSTDVIKFQGQGEDKESFSNVAMERWVQVTLSLTILTIVAAYIGKSLAERRWQREVRPMDAEDLRRRHWISEKWRWRPRASSSVESKV
ncbi:hypothetical protein EG329_012873 [Mollisiaceae sp. DMI_Dod_QoI]|nr:hypothetical protein EG329_012873 [Helotiales sp. DMI_Dod_QoI]